MDALLLVEECDTTAMLVALIPILLPLTYINTLASYHNPVPLRWYHSNFDVTK